MSNTRFMFSAFSVFLAVCCSSCGFFAEPAYRSPVICDIGFPDRPEVLPFRVFVLPLTSDTSARSKMRFRTGNTIVVDEFNRWSQNPSAMLTRYLRLAFTGNDDSRPRNPVYLLSGSVMAFEADIDEKVCRLFFCYQIDDAATERPVRAGVIRITEPLILPENPEEQGKAFAAAMHKASDELVRKLRAVFSGLEKSAPAAK